MPVIRSGHARLYAFPPPTGGGWVDGATLIPATPDTWHAINTGPHQAALGSTIVWSGPTLLNTSTEGNAIPIANVPVGFTPRYEPLINSPQITFPLGNGGFGFFTPVQGGQSGGSSSGGPWGFTLDSAVWLRLTDSASMRIDNYVGPTDAVISNSVGGPTIDFNYDIVGYWWTKITPAPASPVAVLQTPKAVTASPIILSGPQTIGSIPVVAGDQVRVTAQTNPAENGMYQVEPNVWTRLTDPCGNPVVTQLALAASSPGAGWVQANDAVVVPSPIVTAITPSHGLVGGGVAITIKGNYFSLGATVKFDSTAATSVVVVDQYTITCVSPAHSAGTVTVIVTNPDGTHS
jgi:IPT/TIG domain-containing protein